MARRRVQRSRGSDAKPASRARCAASSASRRRARPALAAGVAHDPIVTLGTAALDPLRATIAINVRGGLTIPARLRRALALEPGGRLIVEATPEGVLLRPAITFPRDRCSATDFRAAIEADNELERFLRRRRRRTPG